MLLVLAFIAEEKVKWKKEHMKGKQEEGGQITRSWAFTCSSVNMYTHDHNVILFLPILRNYN